jgi:hypothetical protein
MKEKAVQQDGDCGVMVSDRGDQHSFALRACRFRFKNTFLFSSPVSVDKKCGPNIKTMQNLFNNSHSELGLHRLLTQSSMFPQ